MQARWREFRHLSKTFPCRGGATTQQNMRSDLRHARCVWPISMVCYGAREAGFPNPDVCGENPILPKVMNHNTLRSLGASLGGLLACVALAGAATPTVPPKITSPIYGATPSTAKPLLVRVDNGNLGNVHSVQILSNGTPIGWAVAPNFLGEWEFPESAHLSVMDPDEQWWPDAPPIIMDYHPDASDFMMFFEGDFVSPTRFKGTFSTNELVPQTGNVTVDFVRVGYKVNIVITGDAPIGVRTHEGGVNSHHRTIFTYEWVTPSIGVQNLTAKLVYTDSMTSLKGIYTTATVHVTVKAAAAAEIDVRYKAVGIQDNKTTALFGMVKRRETSKAAYFTIRNVGKQRLTGLKATLAGSHPGDFRVIQPAVTELAPNAETTCRVLFAPTQTGVRKAQLRIRSNDADENPFRVLLSGTGT